MAVLRQQPPGVDDGDANQAAGQVIAEAVTLRRLVELDRGGGILVVEVQDVGVGVVGEVVECQFPDPDAAARDAWR